VITFRIQPHTVRPDVEIVEVFDGDRLVGVLYPHPQGVKFTSKYMTKDRLEYSPGIPAVLLIKLP
jgi:hypothetical protein